MSNKAKKAKQAKLRNKQMAKGLNRVRAQVKQPNLSDKDALFFKKALANKETPTQFVEATADSLIDIVNRFSDIRDLGADDEWMVTIEPHFAGVHESIKNACEYLNGVVKDIEEAREKYMEEYKDLDNSHESFLIASDSMQVFNNIQENLEENLESLVASKKAIIELYQEIESKYPGDETDDN